MVRLSKKEITLLLRNNNNYYDSHFSSDEKYYYIEIALPGFNKKDVNINIVVLLVLIAQHDCYNSIICVIPW